MNWIIIAITIILTTCLLAFIVIKNFKDEKEFEQNLNNDYPKYNKHDENV
jgi:uncharacterized protein YneF (UPF0154 family)